MLQVKERISTPFSSIVFTFGLAFESFKKFGGASFVVCCISTYISMDGCTFASTTFFSLTSIYVLCASTKCYSTALFSFGSSMNIEFTNVTHGPFYFCMPTFFAFTQKINYRCVSHIYIMNYPLRKLHLLIIHLPFYIFQR